MARLRQKGKGIGFVPTLGALHKGHLALVRRALQENDLVVVSIFVNPIQFGPREDFKKYPRPWQKDRALLQANGVDYLFAPSARQMYPSGFSAFVDLDSRLTGTLCGKSRPGHFRGVATVVAKFFNIVQPRAAYFGLKDYQQCVIVRQMVRDLDFPVRLRFVPTVRDRDGLALSSRNIYLSAGERRKALNISQTLFWLRGEIKAGRKDLQRLKREGSRRLQSKTDRVDYFEIVDPETLEPCKTFQKKMAALAACFVGKTRLIDNVIIRVPK